MKLIIAMVILIGGKFYRLRSRLVSDCQHRAMPIWKARNHSIFPLAVNALFVAGLLFWASGCSWPSTLENHFTSSPDGKLVASAYDRVFFRGFMENMEEVRALSELRIRTNGGKLVERREWTAGRNSDEAGIHRLAWNPSGTKLAVLTRDLDVVDASGDMRKHLLHGVSSFCWLDDSNLLCIRTDWNRVVSATRVDVNGKVSEPDFSLRCVPGAAPENCLSPDGKALVLWKGSQAAVVDLANSNRFMPWGVPVIGIEQCFWSSNGKRCLVDVTIVKAETDDSGSKSGGALLYYDRDTEAQIDLTGPLLKQAAASRFLLSGDLFSGNANQLLWGGNGDWFTVTTLKTKTNEYKVEVQTFDTWICTVSPWAAISISEKLGRGFWSSQPSPKGGRLALLRQVNPDDGKNGIYVTEVVKEASGQPGLTPPRCVFCSGEYDLVNWGKGRWWWTGDGQSIVTFDGKRFQIHPVAAF